MRKSANVATAVPEMNSMTLRIKRRSRGADTLLEAANRILRIFGVNTSKHAKQPVPHKSKMNGRSASPMTAPIAQAESPMTSPIHKSPSAADPAPALRKPEDVQNNTNNCSQNDKPNNTKRTAKDFIFGKVIGEGCFSTVYLAKDIHTGKEYAIKVCDKRHIIREKKAEYIKREKEVLNMLFNCNRSFVRLFCTFQDSERLYFVLSYAKNGELLPYINKVGSFDLDVTKFYAAELVVALEQMRNKGIIHRDLKPENILLDEQMHVLVTDFGSAKILKATNDDNRLEQERHQHNDDVEEMGGRRRRMSFVGTAQYVSPELLTDKSASHASDLWALGCIIYQMVSGLPPFRAGSEYLIFQKIINLEYEFPDGFPADAKDLVEKLLVLDPSKRLGAQDKGDTYESIRNHRLFVDIDWDKLHDLKPPPIYPYLPGKSVEDELRSQYRVPDHLEPGLGDLQLTRLLGLDLAEPEPITKSIVDISPEELQRRLSKQRESNKWHRFVDGELILKQGLVDKRKGLFARRRMLLLTTGPRLFYVDPINLVLKGEIPWSPELRAEPKNFRIFFIHTPNRTYYLEDPESYALEWFQTIEEVRLATYPQDTT